MHMKTILLAAAAFFIVAGGVWYMQKDTVPGVTEDEVGEGRELGTAPAVQENIIGIWRSTQDPKFVREFKADGSAVDSYEGSADVKGTWRVFSAQDPIDVKFLLEPDAAYIQITDDSSGLLHFKVGKLTPEELELVYMDRGGVLLFERVQ